MQLALCIEYWGLCCWRGRPGLCLCLGPTCIDRGQQWGRRRRRTLPGLGLGALQWCTSRGSARVHAVSRQHFPEKPLPLKPFFEGCMSLARSLVLLLRELARHGLDHGLGLNGGWEGRGNGEMD